MRQQINLYRPALFEKKVPFSAVHMVLVLGMSVFFALFAGGISVWRLANVEGELVRLQQRQAEAMQRIEEYQRLYPPRTPDPVLARQISVMVAEREARFALLELLTVEHPGNSRGFSRHLEGLAREDLSTVWLRRIRLTAGGHDLLLEGSATRAADIPLYLQRLTRQKDYAGREFDHMQLRRSEETPQVIEFLLQTGQEEKP
jgi:hypothetical protein